MPKTRSELEAECRRAIKVIMSEIDVLADKLPEGEHPYVVEDRRKRVIRTMWDLFKECLNNDPREI